MKRVRMSAEAMRVLATTQLPTAGLPIEDFKHWLSAYHELVAAHDSMVAELQQQDLPQTDRDVHWLVKDFDVLYTAARRVADGWLLPDLPRRVDELGRQLDRLLPAQRLIQGMKEQLRGTGHADAPIYWRGSVTDLVSDLAPLLTPAQLVELAGEAAIAWKKAR